MSLPELLKDFEGYNEYVIWNFGYVDDGYGGQIPSWTPGAHFFGTLTLDESVQMKVAEAQGVKGIYRMTTQKSVRLPYHTVFRTVDNEKTYRVTSKDENATPRRSNIDIRFVSVEDYELTDGGDSNE